MNSITLKISIIIALLVLILPIILYRNNEPKYPDSLSASKIDPTGTLKTRTIRYYPTLQKDYPQMNGSCFTTSWALMARSGTYQCISDDDHIIRDPCFAMGDRVICDENPLHEGDEVELILTAPLPRDEGGKASNTWTILLADGTECQFDESNGEKMIGDDYINHLCTGNKVLTENFETSGDFVTWEVGQLSDDEPRRIISREMVPVLKIWE